MKKRENENIIAIQWLIGFVQNMIKVVYLKFGLIGVTATKWIGKNICGAYTGLIYISHYPYEYIYFFFYTHINIFEGAIAKVRQSAILLPKKKRRSVIPLLHLWPNHSNSNGLTHK